MSKTLPPGQTETNKWPILHEGDVYRFDEQTWDFQLFGEVENNVSLTYEEVMNLPKVTTTVDIHCVTTWSKFDTTFEGIPFREFLNLVTVKPEVKYVRIYGYLEGDRFGYSSNLPLEALQEDDALFVYRWKDAKNDWDHISAKHGFPLRFVPPASFYFWKGSKWASGIEFLTENKPGYWEERGYHMDADPFQEQRFANPEAKPSGYGGADEWNDQ